MWWTWKWRYELQTIFLKILNFSFSKVWSSSVVKLYKNFMVKEYFYWYYIIFYNSSVVVPTISRDANGDKLDTDLNKELERNFQLVIVELVNSDTNWEELFSSNFKTHKKDGVVCNIRCPVILQWSSWSCHCSQSQGHKTKNLY